MQVQHTTLCIFTDPTIIPSNLRFMKRSIEEAIQSHAMKVQARMVKVVSSALGDDAGIIGAKVLFDEPHPEAVRYLR